MFTAERAAGLELVNTLADEASALDVALELAGVIATNGPLAVAATKRIARGGADWSLAEGWAAQNAIVDTVLASDDARKAWMPSPRSAPGCGVVVEWPLPTAHTT